MASLRILVSAVTSDAIATRNIRLIEEVSVVNLWATCVTVTDTIGLKIGKVTLMDQSTLNIRAAAIGIVDVSDSQLVFNALVGPGAGDLGIPIDTLTTSLIFLLSVEPAI